MLDFVLSQGKLSVDEQSDEALNRTSSLLKALVNVICYSPVCEKKAVFTCVQLIKEKNLSVELVRKVGRTKFYVMVSIFSCIIVNCEKRLKSLISSILENWCIQQKYVHFIIIIILWGCHLLCLFFIEHYDVYRKHQIMRVEGCDSRIASSREVVFEALSPYRMHYMFYCSRKRKEFTFLNCTLNCSFSMLYNHW